MSHFAAVAAMALRPEARTRYVRTPMAVELVTGPPGSGKSTLVRQRAGERDALIDLDAIGDALSAKGGKLFGLMPVTWCARDAAMLALAQLPVDLPPRLWIVACAPTRQERHHAAVPFADVRLTVLEVPPEECVRRIEARRLGRARAVLMGDVDHSPYDGTDWSAIVEEWWRRYRRPTPDEGWTAVEVAG